MAPKKDKGKAKVDEENVGGFNEVEKTFLELQITEGNRKIARLRTTVDEYEVRNEELQKAYDKLDEDRADIIAYLKKALFVKNEENTELKEKVKGLEEMREIENTKFRSTVNTLENNFTVMKDQLTAENKLLAGKINTLEEFRSIRDDLMKKFEHQEEEFQNQELKYKRIIYDAEKKFVIGKDKLKKEMEARLLQLAQDFQDATELRIAASTHRVIRENIALSHELDHNLKNQQRMAELNKMYKANTEAAQLAKELADEERDKAINKSIVQLRVIEQLTTAFDNLKKDKILQEKRSFDFETLQSKIQNLSKENENLSLQIRVLEQNLHVRLTEQNKYTSEVTKVSGERDDLREILQKAAIAIQSALKLDQWAQGDPERKSVERQYLLSHLLEIVSQYRHVHGSQSLDTLASFSKVYEEGDLGFVPKSFTVKKASWSFEYSPVIHPQKTELIEETDRNLLRFQKSLSEIESSSVISSSITTIPVMQIIPENEIKDTPEKEPSIESFVTSLHDTIDEESDMNEQSFTEQEPAKLEIQKSIIKDLTFSPSSTKPPVTQISTASMKLLDKKETTERKKTKEVDTEECVDDLLKEDKLDEEVEITEALSYLKLEERRADADDDSDDQDKEPTGEDT